MTAPPELLTPTSPAEAAAAFGDGAGVTVMGGGTILLPELTYGRLRPDARADDRPRRSERRRQLERRRPDRCGHARRRARRTRPSRS